MKDKILLALVVIISACTVESFSQDIWNEIPGSSFEMGTYIEDTSFFYACRECSMKIEYLKEKNDKQFFHIGKDTFLIGDKEALQASSMKFYYVSHNKLKYLVVASHDFRVLGNNYSHIMNYYVFELDEKNNRVRKYFNLPLSKLSKEDAFKILVKN